MTFLEKIQTLESYLSLPEQSYSDSFKQDIIIFFDENFTTNNEKLKFLKNLNTKEEISTFIDKLTSRFTIKFESESEQINDFIYDFIELG